MFPAVSVAGAAQQHVEPVGERMSKHSRIGWLFGSAVAVVALTAMPLSAQPSQLLAQPSQQEHVHHMSHAVMPFDMSKTVHIFKMTEKGGVERVVTREAGEKDQVTLIQQHLKHEAEMFQKGDYSDPAKLHGANMPGLK
ncbi:MAG: hypothetical protein WBN82_03650, partial [Porticoccaceae bacterium]